MKIRDVGPSPTREDTQQLVDWSRNKVSFTENLDCKLITIRIGLTETEVGHSLGRAPKYVIELAAYPGGTAGISHTRAPEVDKLWLTRSVDGETTLLIF